MNILSLVGGNAFSDFVINKFVISAKKRNFIIPEQISTNYIYIIENKLNNVKNFDNIYSILNTKNTLKITSEDKFFIIIPRFGTVSAWSSKATDILKKCGLYFVNRIERGILFKFSDSLSTENLISWSNLIIDKMTQSVIFDKLDINKIFNHPQPKTFKSINVLNTSIKSLKNTNKKLGLALSNDEIEYLFHSYNDLNKNPTDIELMMFSQVNSEHCRHKIFNAKFIIDNKEQEKSLFQMIKDTHIKSPKGTILAYKDNSSILEGDVINRFYPNPSNKNYSFHKELTNIIIKVETHNHPTAISPFSGSATGSGGEIRDEGATGKGAKPKAGLVGYTLSNLNIPNLIHPWENYYIGNSTYGSPDKIASPLDIIIQAPIGAAYFNNEFGRPNILGYFRTFELDFNNKIRGFHKPIMIAGGIGNIQDNQNFKDILPEKALIIVLGGPGFLIGLGGGSASSMQSGSNDNNLDFDSVQRDNPEMQRRCQEVIDRCWQLKNKNPIITIHDVGAGGLSNAISELINDSNKGCIVDLRKIPIEDYGMSPLQIWCNESQERYVLSILDSKLNVFVDICKRENCPFAILGEVTNDKNLIIKDTLFNNNPVNMPLDILFAKVPKLVINDTNIKINANNLILRDLDFKESLYRVLQFPAVSSKNFLITISDRSVGGLVAKDQMVGPMQVPVSDCSVTLMDFTSFLGEAMSMGERSPYSLLDEVSSVRMAIAESITNIMCTNIGSIDNLKLSANWMACGSYEGEYAKLYNAVKASSILCQDLNISIPVGKDSLSMSTTWKEKNEIKSVISPLSLIVSAFCKVKDVRKTMTPELRNKEDSSIILFDLGFAKNRTGGSCFAQVYKSLDKIPPNLDDHQDLVNLFNFIQLLIQDNKILSYHDRSDGGLIITLLEMMFAGNIGLDINLDSLFKNNDNNLNEILFNEELGCVIQIDNKNLEQIIKLSKKYNLFECMHTIGKINNNLSINLFKNNNLLFCDNLLNLKKLWNLTSYNISRLRDNPICADSEFDLITSIKSPLLFSKLSFDIEDINLPYINHGLKPKVAILREQGTNGNIEMSFAFNTAGFDCIDVHMNDLFNNKCDINDYNIIVVCGGFSYGDVLGAGVGWSNTILYNTKLRDSFEKFFSLKNNLALGICNGCQMLSNLREIIPGTNNWPYFTKNQSEQFEARVVMVRVNDSPSIFFRGMENSSIPIVVSHSEGRACFDENTKNLFNKDLISLQYVDQDNLITLKYPLNPNGSDFSIAAVTNDDGRVTIVMPHPERVTRKVQFSWAPDDWKSDMSPWMQMFINARKEFN